MRKSTEDYLKIIKNPSIPLRTITYLIKGDKVLLGYKKRGFGKGNFLGIGGKVEPGERVEEAAKREVREEINVEILDLKLVGVIKFYFPCVKDESWNQEDHVYIATKWKGKIQESEEISPEWFYKNRIPYEKMWDDAKYYLPQILEGKKLEASFVFDKNLKVVDKVLIGHSF